MKVDCVDCGVKMDLQADSCPNCGGAAGVTCGGCGSKIELPADSCGHCGAAVNTKCGGCGTKIGLDSDSCPSCGAILKNGGSSSLSAPNVGRNLLIPVGTVFLAFGVLVSFGTPDSVTGAYGADPTTAVHGLLGTGGILILIGMLMTNLRPSSSSVHPVFGVILFLMGVAVFVVGMFAALTIEFPDIADRSQELPPEFLAISLIFVALFGAFLAGKGISIIR